jgi:hypothetical protein
MREYTPIVVVYKLPKARKLRIKVFTNLSCPDPILGKKSSKYLPQGTELIEIGVGKSFYEKYKKKHNL